MEMNHKNYKPEPPDHLSDDAKLWFGQVVETFALEPHHVRLLTLAAQAWDRAEEARIHLVIFGTTYTDRFGQPKARPEVAIERDSRIAFARLLRELGLESAPADSPRPPSIGR
jgi:phage terminase small subunit